jgi:hypothetical protein
MLFAGHGFYRVGLVSQHVRPGFPQCGWILLPGGEYRRLTGENVTVGEAVLGHLCAVCEIFASTVNLLTPAATAPLQYLLIDVCTGSIAA